MLMLTNASTTLRRLFTFLTFKHIDPNTQPPIPNTHSQIQNTHSQKVEVGLRQQFYQARICQGITWELHGNYARICAGITWELRKDMLRNYMGITLGYVRELHGNYTRICQGITWELRRICVGITLGYVRKLHGNQGLFIDDVIIFWGYRDPPPPPRHHSSLFSYPPLNARVTRDITDFATKQRMMDF